MLKSDKKPIILNKNKRKRNKKYGMIVLIKKKEPHIKLLPM